MNIKINFRLAIFFALFIGVISFAGCKKEISNEDITVPVVPIDLSTKVTAKMVSGFVTDGNNQAVKDAIVRIGTSSTTTDKYGYFKIENVDVVKTAATVTATKSGFFPGIKTWVGEEGKSAFFRIKLLPKTTAGTIDAAAGGTATTTDGLDITLPAGGVVVVNGGAAYTGPVTVLAKWIDPSGQFINEEMPGDLRGISTANTMRLLTTYGMAAVELTGSAGQLLQIASGKKATLSYPIPASFAGSAPATIPMWYFDEAKGLWVEDGTGTKTGGKYVAEVSHFSFWNCDVPNNYVDFSMTLKRPDGSPLQYTSVKITEVANPNNYRFGYTDSSGYVHGLVPANAQLRLDVYTYNYCNTSLFNQNVTTTNVPLALGNVTVTIAPANIANITGILTNCSGQPVTSGYLMLQYGYWYHRINVGAGGVINSSIPICSSMAATAVGVDLSTMQESNPVNFTLSSGTNNLGTIISCGNSIAQFFNYTINGTGYSYTAPADSLTLMPLYNGTNSYNALQMYASNSTSTTNLAYLRFTNASIAAGSTQTMLRIKLPQMTDSSTTAIPVNITEFGAYGQFISGNFSGTFSYFNTPATSVTITGSFRARKYF